MTSAQTAVEKVKGQVEKAGPKSIQDLIQASAKELGRALPEHMKPERLVRIALTCIRLNPKLAECTPASFLGALFTSAQLGIEPVAGLGYLLPFKNKRKIGNEWREIPEVQFLLGYKGAATLFYRHEKSVLLSWGVVKEKDDFSYEYGTNAHLKHRPALSARGATQGYYVVAELKNGGKPFMYMSKEECLEHGKKHSKTFDKTEKAFLSSSPWKTNEDSMCLKTVLIQLAKVLPLSVELHRALGADETSREYRAGVDNALDLPSQTGWEGEEEAPAQEISQPEPPEQAPPKKTALDINIHEFKKKVGDKAYYKILGDMGVEHMTELSILDREVLLNRLKDALKQQKREPGEEG